MRGGERRAAARGVVLASQRRCECDWLQNAQGLVHLRARWYTPSTGTFTSRDPFAGWAEQPYSLHPYQYAYANPALHTDPSGQCVGILAGIDTAVCVGIFFAVLAAAGGVTGDTPANQQALDDASDAFVDAVTHVEELRDGARARMAWFAFDTLGGLVGTPEGFDLSAPDPVTVLIFLIDQSVCQSGPDGFSLQTPNLYDLVRLGPPLVEVLTRISTASPPDDLPVDPVKPSGEEHTIYQGLTEAQKKEVHRLI